MKRFIVFAVVVNMLSAGVCTMPMASAHSMPSTHCDHCPDAMPQSPMEKGACDGQCFSAGAIGTPANTISLGQHEVAGPIVSESPFVLLEDNPPSVEPNESPPIASAIQTIVLRQ